jgi:predicted ATP-dependent endonuclease of OLD family
MLTRLKVSGFKNLVDVNVRFGPFTCVAGANGVGKSNLFHAIRFLSAIADLPLIEAALSVRDEEGRTADVRSLFHRVSDEYDAEMSFEAEMIVPEEGVDDLGQQAKASITFLRYFLALAYRSDDSLRSLGSLEILKEELVHINLGDAKKTSCFLTVLIG